MNFLKKNYKLFVGILIGLIIASSIAVYATYSYFADGVGYTRQGSNVENVEQALNELYSLINRPKTKSSIIASDSRDLVLYNGCEIRKDESDDYYLYFDGSNDYAQIVGSLPSTIDWANGFTIEFEAKWDATNNWSRILDFGVGTTYNIFVGNYGTSSDLIISSRNGGTEYFNGNRVNMSLTQKAKYKIIVEKLSSNSYRFSYYRNDSLINQTTMSGSVINTTRTSNYIGKSNFGVDAYFKGRIYSLKIDQANGTNIIDIDVDSLV